MMSYFKFAVLAALAMTMPGCRYFDTSDSVFAEPSHDAPAAPTLEGQEQVWLLKAKDNFRNGEYGLAERYYRRAVEDRYQNVEAWIGLAATYDHLKRFDEADRAYKIVTKLAGNTPSVLNNLGYHYMLKGDYAAAENTLRAAQEQDPGNPHIQSNLNLLAELRANSRRSG